jgi:hypothetical protein
MKNDFSKIYSKEELRNNRIVTVASFPLEESVMFPVSQAIDLMKQGENILYFTFNHDSIKLNTFFQEFLKREDDPSSITGQLAIFDAHQMGSPEDWMSFISNTIKTVKKECELEFVFFDLLPFLEDVGIDESRLSDAMIFFAESEKLTPIIVRTLRGPVITAIQNPREYQESLDGFMDKDMFQELIQTSRNMVHKSDYILGIQRNKEGWWKKLWRKIKNFLLFWRKRDSFENNFRIHVIKNRSGSDGITFDANMDLENPKIEIL